jgi:hypothetical protein
MPSPSSPFPFFNAFFETALTWRFACVIESAHRSEFSSGRESSVRMPVCLSLPRNLVAK